MSEQRSNGFMHFIKTHRGVAIGMAVGFAIGLLVLLIGFFRTLFLAICVGIGAFFGTNTPLKKRLMNILDRILPDIFK